MHFESNAKFSNAKIDLFWLFFYRGWPFMTSWYLLSENLRQERHFDIQFTNFQWLLKFDLFSEFLTSVDLCWPRDPFFWKADVKSVILIYHLLTFNEFWNLTYFRNFWPRMTFVDLVTPFFEKLTSRASFWYIIYSLSMTFEIWPIFGIFDLGWPFLTPWPLLSKSWRQERHFDIQFTHFQ